MNKKIVSLIVGSFATTGVFIAPVVANAHPFPNHCPVYMGGGVATSVPAGLDSRNPANCEFDWVYSDGSKNVMEYGPGGWRYGRVCPGEKLPDMAHARTYIPGQCK